MNVTVWGSLFFVLLFSGISHGASKTEVKYLGEQLRNAPEETKDLGKLMTEIRLEPTKDSEYGKGVARVVEVKKGSYFDQIGIKVGDLVSFESRTKPKVGFKKGDVVKSATGTPVESPEKALEMYNSLKKKGDSAGGKDKD